MVRFLSIHSESHNLLMNELYRIDKGLFDAVVEHRAGQEDGQHAAGAIGQHGAVDRPARR